MYDFQKQKYEKYKYNTNTMCYSVVTSLLYYIVSFRVLLLFARHAANYIFFTSFSFTELWKPEKAVKVVCP